MAGPGPMRPEGLGRAHAGAWNARSDGIWRVARKGMPQAALRRKVLKAAGVPIGGSKQLGAQEAQLAQPILAPLVVSTLDWCQAASFAEGSLTRGTPSKT